MSAIEQLNQPNFPQKVADIFAALLNDHGRLNLLAMGLRLAPHTEALELVDAFLTGSYAGYPTPSLEAAINDAEWHAWASTPFERKAYALAHFKAMPTKQQSAFLDFVTSSREVA